MFNHSGSFMLNAVLMMLEQESVFEQLGKEKTQHVVLEILDATGTLEIDRRRSGTGTPNGPRTVTVASGTTPWIRLVHQQLWRVFYTKPRAEMAAEKRPFPRTWSDRQKKVIEPLFRSYIFAKVNELGRLDVLRDDAILTTIRDATINVPFGDWEEIPRLQAKTSV